MKRISFICLLIMACSLSGQAQFWIDFGWNEPHCRNCQWMEQALRLQGRQAAKYHETIHKYGQRIEREARRDYRYWDKSARKIYDLRMARDRNIERLLSPSQFRSYIGYIRQDPKRIHDYKNWYNNPSYPGHRPSHDCRQYENTYWSHKWKSDNRRHDDDHYDRDWDDDNDHHNNGRSERSSRPRSNRH